MRLTIRCFDLPDPDGHRPELLLRGDWLIVAISDGEHEGCGEASHSGDDRICRQTIEQLFARHVAGMAELSLESIRALECGPFAQAESFLQATAISGINQALYELLAKRRQVPVWRLLAETPCRTRVPVYATINRALRHRTIDDYRRSVREALDQGFTTIKCAPFERVTSTGDQVTAAEHGFERLEALRDAYPDLRLRIDCHERFQLEPLRRMLPRLDALCPNWLEAPIPIGRSYESLRQWTMLPIAAGELYFGWLPFEELVFRRWVDIIMPDVKHVGGFGPLIDVCRRAAPTEVSPHNPSGPIATAASLHAAAVCPHVTSVELVLIGDRTRAYYLSDLRDGSLPVPTAVGWGVGDFGQTVGAPI